MIIILDMNDGRQFYAGAANGAGGYAACMWPVRDLKKHKGK
jgi:hypothetical protein